MRPRSAAILAIRVFALVIAVEAITGIVSLLAFTAQLGQGGGTSALWAPLIVRLVIAVALLVSAEDLSGLVARGTDEEPPVVARRTANVAAVALAVVGVVLVSEAITGFVGTIASQSSFGSESVLRFNFTGPGFFGGRGAAILVELIQLVIGLGLIVSSGNFARYLSRKFPESEPPPAA